MPRIKTTRTVQVALVVLLIYLVVMLSLILFKFIYVAFRAVKPAGSNPPASAPRDTGTAAATSGQHSGG